MLSFENSICNARFGFISMEYEYDVHLAVLTSNQSLVQKAERIFTIYYPTKKKQYLLGLHNHGKNWLFVGGSENILAGPRINCLLFTFKIPSTSILKDRRFINRQ